MIRVKGGVCLAVLALAASGSTAFAGRWHLQPHLEVLETYTDNVDLQPINPKDDFITRASPGLHLKGEGARISMDVDYTANFLYFAKSSDKTELRHNLAGRLNSQLVDETLYLDGAASIDQQFVDPGAAFSTNFDNRTQNRATVQNYLVSPSLKHGFGSWGTAVARYDLNYIKSDANRNIIVPGQVLQASTSHDFLLSFNSGRMFPRLVWGVEGDYQLRTRQGGVGDSKRTTVRANASYPLTTWLSLVGSAGYEKINDNTLTSRPDGFIWDAGVSLRPGPRTTLSARAGRRYNDTTYSLDGQYLFSPRTRLSLGYHDTITTSQDILAQQLANSGQTGAGSTFGTIPGNQSGLGLINSSFRRKRFDASISGTRGRNTLQIGGYYETRFIDATQDHQKDFGGTVGFRRAIGPHLNGFITGDYRRTEFRNIGLRQDHIYSAQAGFDYTITHDLSAGVTYIMNRRDSNQALFNMKENAVRINVLATF